MNNVHRSHVGQGGPRDLYRDPRPETRDPRLPYIRTSPPSSLRTRARARRTFIRPSAIHLDSVYEPRATSFRFLVTLIARTSAHRRSDEHTAVSRVAQNNTQNATHAMIIDDACTTPGRGDGTIDDCHTGDIVRGMRPLGRRRVTPKKTNDPCMPK